MPLASSQTPRTVGRKPGIRGGRAPPLAQLEGRASGTFHRQKLNRSVKRTVRIVPALVTAPNPAFSGFSRVPSTVPSALY